MEDVWVEARGWESVWGDTVPSFGATFHTMKKYIYIYNPAQTTMTGGDKSNNWKENTQQPTRQ